MSRRVDRRQFLKAGGISAATVGFWVAGGSSETHAAQGANERLNIALIGAGGRAEGNEEGVRGENIVAICDVDENRARNVFNRYPKVTKYTDFRQMLEKQKDIQAVVVSTPDHTHFHASATAIRMGKHVYCEKPLTHSVWEARQLRELAQKHRVATQMGNQGTSEGGLRTAVEVIRSGALGDVREVHVWTNRPIWPQGMNRPKQTPAVPRGLNWNLWLGPAPQRPYHGAYMPFSWRGWWDFGTGALGDMACHTMNLPYMALRLGAPSAISAVVVGDLNPETAPARGVTVTYEFPARGEGMPACRLFWYESPYQPNVPRERREYRRPPMNLFRGLTNISDSGCLVVGNKGTLYSGSDYGSSYRLLPEADFRDYRPPQPTLPRSPGHHAEWIRACKGGAPAMSNFVDYSGQFAETVLLGNVAMRVSNGNRIVWDSAKLHAVDAPTAAQYIRRQYRKGWEWTA